MDYFCVFVTQRFVVTTTPQRHLHNPAQDINTYSQFPKLGHFQLKEFYLHYEFSISCF